MAITVRFSGGHSFKAPGGGTFENTSPPHSAALPHSINFTEATTVTGLKLTDLGDGNFELTIEAEEQA